MPDYYAVLDRKIQEANSDPAKVREVVYEAARLALRSQLHEQWPHLSVVESKRHLIELEDAIARMEANATSGSRRPQQATTRPPSEQNSITLDQGEAGAADTVRPDGAQPPETAAAEVAGLEAVAAVLAKTSQRGGARFDEPRPQVQNGHSAEPMTRDGHGHPADFTHPTRAAAIENQQHDYPAASAQFAPTPADEHSAEPVRVEVVDERGRRKMSKARRHSEPIRLDDASGLPEQHHSAELAQSETAAADSNWGSTREPEQSRSDRKPTINAGLHSDIDSHRQPYQRFTTELRSLENGGGDGLRESHRWQQFSRQRANWKASERSSHPHDLDATSQVHNAPNERSEADDPSAPNTRYPTGPPVVERMKLPAPPEQDTNQREKGAARRLWARHGLQAQTERVDHLPEISDRPYQQDPFHREQPDWKGQCWINKTSEGRATARGVQGHFAGPESEAAEDPDTTPIRVQLPDQGAPRGNSSSPGPKRRTKSENNLANRDLRSAPIKPGESRAPDSKKDAYTHRWDSLPASDQEHEAQFRPADSDSEWGKKAHSQHWDSFLAPGEDDEIESRPTNSAADFASPTGSRELALIPNRAKRSTYIVTPNDFISPEVTLPHLTPAPAS